MFVKNYKAKVVIKARQHDVWKVLTNLDAYEQWNPFTPKVEAEWKIGSKVKLTVRMRPGKSPIQQTEYLSKFNEPFELAWGMRWGFFVKAERIQRLTIVENEQTEYFTEDIISGLMTPIVHLLYGKFIQNGFEQVAMGLKKFVEGR